jgi:hypothetical protein
MEIIVRLASNIKQYYMIIAVTSLCSFIDNISDLEPTSENTFSIKSPSQAPKSLIAFPKSAKDCPSSKIENQECVIDHIQFNENNR